MRVVLSAIGTIGDVLPLIALARELRTCGHAPLIALSPYHRELVERRCLPFAPIGPDVRSIVRDLNLAMVHTPEVSRSPELLRELAAPFAAALPSVFADLRELCETADCLVCGSTQPAGRMVHELDQIPFASVSIIVPGTRGTRAYRTVTAEYINGFRRRLGLPDVADPLTVDSLSPQLTMFALSRFAAPPPADAPREHVTIGFFFDDEPEWRPSPEVCEFLDGGDPPIAISFGSNFEAAPERLTRLILRAVDGVGCRAIIQDGWGGLAAGALPPHVLATGYIPHAYLFPRVCCVVHHGGCGTSACALRSGTPSVVVPHVYDQFLWATLLRDLGCAGPGVPYRALTAERLAEAIAATLADGAMRARAAEVARSIRTEDGVRTACGLLRRLVARTRRHAFVS